MVVLIVHSANGLLPVEEVSESQMAAVNGTAPTAASNNWRDRNNPANEYITGSS